MVAFAVSSDGVWSRQGPAGSAMRPCQNYTAEQVCNWMVSAESADLLCASCLTTETIPDLSKNFNRSYWALLEQAKRRLFYTLLDLRLPVPSKAIDPVNGLAFRFLEDPSPREHVLTGHDEGVITMNIAEADDVTREHIRAAMHEPYRTLLGHFRHESGHYYWDRLIRDSPRINEYRALFGDERADYAEALNQHYSGPASEWSLRHISAYASSHPWEDWAECWAHYLHMVDGLDTAGAWGLRLDNATPGASAVKAHAVDSSPAALYSSIIEQWLPVSQFINELNRGLGLHDSYPFVVPEPVVEKLAFIHRTITAQSAHQTIEKQLAPSTPQAPRASRAAGSRRRRTSNDGSAPIVAQKQPLRTC